MSKQEKKDSTREEYCALIADLGVDNAIKLSGIFISLLKQLNITIYDPSKILIGFTFMNWGIANGVWTNLKNANLRRDLMTTSQRALVLKVARKIKEGEPPDDIAFLAVQIDEEFQRFFRIYIQRIKELDRQEHSLDETAVLLITLEWIQENMGLKDLDMDKVILAFLEQSTDLDEITSVAMELIHAEERRKKKGVLRRFLEK